LHTLDIDYTLGQGAHHTTGGSGGYTTKVKEGSSGQRQVADHPWENGEHHDVPDRPVKLNLLAFG
jgi:hypothetical protein